MSKQTPKSFGYAKKGNYAKVSYLHFGTVKKELIGRRSTICRNPPVRLGSSLEAETYLVGELISLIAPS